MGLFWIDWTNLHNYCCYANECFINYFDWDSGFWLRKRDDLR